MSVFIVHTKEGNTDMYYNHRGEKIVRQSIILNPFIDIGLAGVTYPNPNYRIMHNIKSRFFYDYYVFEYVVSGKGYIETANDFITVQAGDLYFLNKLHQHIYYSDPTEPYEKIFITVKGHLIDALVDAYKINDSVIVNQCDIVHFMNDLLTLADTQNSLPYDDLSIRILQLFQFLRNSYNMSELYNKNTAEIIKNYLDSNLTTKISLDDICQDCHISKSHAERLFGETYEISPLKYFSRAKAIHVATLLKETNYSLSEIADLMSYSDVKYMSKCFKKWIGQTPLNYRKNRRKLNASAETKSKGESG